MSANRPNRPNDALANYVPVAERIEKFHERYPEGRILTTIVEHDTETGFILMRAEVYRNNDAAPAATGHAFEVRGESYVNKTSYVENCETGSVGRALAMLGFEVKRGLASREEMEKPSRMTPDTAPRPPRPEASSRPEPSRAEPPRAAKTEETADDEEPLRAAPTLGAPASAAAISGGRLPNVPARAGAEIPASEEQKSEILGLLEQLRPRDRKSQRALLMEKTGKGLRDELTASEARRLIDDLKG